jgi:hypothetical protein
MVATIGATLTSSVVAPTLAWQAWRAHIRQMKVDAYCADWHSEWPDNKGRLVCQGLWDEDPDHEPD